MKISSNKLVCGKFVYRCGMFAGTTFDVSTDFMPDSISSMLEVVLLFNYSPFSAISCCAQYHFFPSINQSLSIYILRSCGWLWFVCMRCSEKPTLKMLMRFLGRKTQRQMARRPISLKVKAAIPVWCVLLLRRFLEQDREFNYYF